MTSQTTDFTSGQRFKTGDRVEVRPDSRRALRGDAFGTVRVDDYAPHAYRVQFERSALIRYVQPANMRPAPRS